MKDFIDYSIIWKFIHSDLDEKEQNELNYWLETDPKHRRYFENAVRDSKKMEVSPESKPGNATQKMIHEKRYESKRIIFVGKVAVLFFLIVGAGFAIYFLSRNSEKELNSVEISFDPGIQKAILVLNNGTKLNLEANKDTLLLQEKTEIRNTGAKLQYNTISKNKQINDKEDVQYNTLLVPRGGEYVLVLADGTKVYLNSESILKFPVNFTGETREVQLKGEAYFEVKTDASRPFIVNTGSVVTKVLGTSFNINSYPEKDLITTTLVEGHVSILKTDSNIEDFQLLPGEQSIFSKKGETIQKSKVDIIEYTAWKDGRFVFRDKTLQEITDILGRWYDVNFVFEDPEISRIRFTGNLKRYENIQQILSKISKTNEVKFTAYEKTIYLN